MNFIITLNIKTIPKFKQINFKILNVFARDNRIKIIPQIKIINKGDQDNTSFFLFIIYYFQIS